MYQEKRYYIEMWRSSEIEGKIFKNRNSNVKETGYRIKERIKEFDRTQNEVRLSVWFIFKGVETSRGLK